MAFAPAAVPQDLVAGIEEQCDEIWLSWTQGNSSNTTYHIYRNDVEDPDDPGLVEIGSTTSTSFVDIGDVGGIVQGDTYYYWVESVTSGEAICGASGFSDVAAGQTAIDPPVAPEFVYATDSGISVFCDLVEITWLPDPTAQTYLVWRSTSDVADEAVQIAETAATSFQDVTAIAGNEYTYWVTSGNACALTSDINLANSDTGSLGQLDAPVNVEATDSTASCGQVDIDWDPVDYATAYFVYRSDTSDFAGAVLIGLADSNQFTDFVPSVYDTPMYYFISSVSEFCQAPVLHSPAVSGSALPPLTIPTDVIASVGTACGEIWVNWTGAANDQYYDIYRNETGDSPVGGDLHPSSPWAMPPFVDGTVVDDTQYYYFVVAHNNCGDSDPSLDAMGMAGVELDSPAAIVSQGSSCDVVDISWNESRRMSLQKRSKFPRSQLERTRGKTRRRSPVKIITTG